MEDAGVIGTALAGYFIILICLVFYSVLINTAVTNNCHCLQQYSTKSD